MGRAAVDAVPSAPSVRRLAESGTGSLTVALPGDRGGDLDGATGGALSGLRCALALALAAARPGRRALSCRAPGHTKGCFVAIRRVR